MGFGFGWIEEMTMGGTAATVEGVQPVKPPYTLGSCFGS